MKHRQCLDSIFGAVLLGLSLTRKTKGTNLLQPSSINPNPDERRKEDRYVKTKGTRHVL